MSWNDSLMDQGPILLRIPGDAALMLSYPILWWRLYSVGFSAVSIQTQLLHALVFIFRYVFYPGDFMAISILNALAKFWLILWSISTVVILFRHRQRSLNEAPLRPRSIFLSLTFLTTAGWGALLLVPVLIAFVPVDDKRLQAGMQDMAWYLLSEIPWSISQVLGIIAMIPQLRMLYRSSGTIIREDEDGKPMVFISPPEGKFSPDLKIRQVDDQMWYYIVSVATFRTFYIIYWFASDGEDAFAPKYLNLMRVGAVAQVVIIHGFIFAILLREKRARRWLKQQQALQQDMPHDSKTKGLVLEKTPASS
ncbi:hypothetical protein DL93DRAFT_1384344 [Clavulina sp. PMI_390]|nr:hypothetical protein DL93DRAFT_1384344 [Clavulina sp. PMI_390]